tara:strand:+ start:40939 stop:41787 length:849 start_codon:yes stop_codon:yes gene_type:complete
MSSKNETGIDQVSKVKAFGGQQIRVTHWSETLQCKMQFSVFLPAASEKKAVPAVYFLSGLTCNDENFSTKAGAQRVAAELGLALVIPDTSPRGDDVPDDEGYDLGKGAGFYVNATQYPWQTHYKMYDYITKELPAVVEGHFPVSARRSICGHSMGGHGAIIMAVREPENYCSVSAFAPIVNPSQCPWGHKAFSAYLGDEQADWLEYDSVELIKKRGLKLPLLVDQGTEDNFFPEQLLTDNLSAATDGHADVQVRYQTGYDHSYYFIASFIEEHLRFHARYLG